MHTRYQLQSLKAWGLVQSLVFQRNLRVTSWFNYKTIRRATTTLLLRRLWEARSGFIKSIQLPLVKIQCLYSFTTHTRGLEKNLQERFETIHNEPRSVILTCGMMHQEQKVILNAFPYEHLALCARINLILLLAGI